MIHILAKLEWKAQPSAKDDKKAMVLHAFMPRLFLLEFDLSYLSNENHQQLLNTRHQLARA